MAAAGVALGRNQVALLLCVLLLAAAAADILSAPRPGRFLRERLGVLTTMAIVCTAVLLVLSYRGRVVGDWGARLRRQRFARAGLF